MFHLAMVALLAAECLVLTTGKKEFMMETIPLHPFLVHFPLGGWLIGTVLLWIGVLRPRAEWNHAAWWCLAIAALVSIPAALAGQADLAEYSGPIYIEVERHRMLGNLLPWLMMGVVLYGFHIRYKKNAYQPPILALPILASIVTGLVIYTGLLGGKLVYLLGVAGVFLGVENSSKF